MNDLKRILLVEDNPGDADLILEMLPTSGFRLFEVTCATRLSQAVEHLAASRFDIILLDLGLPDSDGIKTLRAMRLHTVDLPIVVLTGNNDEQTGLTAVLEGAQDYLIKGQIHKDLLNRSITYAVARKLAENKLKNLNETLEIRIAERTAQLTASNEALQQEIAEHEMAQEALLKAFDEIKTLRGIVPICANCKKIRDDKGYWNQVEVYVRDHTEAVFSHGLCPDCVKELYPDLQVDFGTPIGKGEDNR